MVSDKTGGPAFPNQVRITDEKFAELRGMTLRDYFAAKAMQGMMANPSMFRINFIDGQAHADFHETNISASFQIADRMLKERAK